MVNVLLKLIEHEGSDEILSEILIESSGNLLFQTCRLIPLLQRCAKAQTSYVVCTICYLLGPE